jgi:hypothetical protein
MLLVPSAYDGDAFIEQPRHAGIAHEIAEESPGGARLTS